MCRTSERNRNDSLKSDGLNSLGTTHLEKLPNLIQEKIPTRENSGFSEVSPPMPNYPFFSVVLPVSGLNLSSISDPEFC